MLNKKMQYVIKTCSSENTQELQNLLNEMSMNDWELYSMQEVENDDGQILCHCIFMKEASPSNNDKNAEFLLALKPLLREERQSKVDKAVKMLKLFTVWTVLKDSGLLNDLF